MTKKQKTILWVVISVILLVEALFFAGCVACVCNTCVPSEKRINRVEEMFNSFPKANNYVLLTNRELVYRGNRIPLDEITYNGKYGEIVYLDQEGFYSYVSSATDDELTVTFYYTTYADLRLEELGQIQIPGRQSFHCVFYDGSYNISLSIRTDGEWRDYKYRWSVSEKALVEPFETRPYDFDSPVNNRESDYSFESKSAFFYNRLEITEKSTGIKKSIRESFLKTFAEGKEIRRAHSAFSSSARPAYVVGDDIYLVLDFGVDGWGDDMYIYVVKWNFRTEESAFFTWVHFDNYQKRIEDFIILE